MTRANSNSQPPKKDRGATFHVLRTLTVTLVVSALIVIGGFSYLALKPNQLRPILEHLLTSITERQFQIAGDFDFQLGKELLIHAKYVTWANASWGSAENMLEINSIDLQINLASLFSPPVIISHVNVENAHLEFEWDDDGRMNWMLFDTDTDTDTDDGDPSAHPLPLLLGITNLNSVELAFKAPILTSPLLIKVISAKQELDQDNNIVIRSKALTNNRPFTLDGNMGRFSELVLAGEVSMDLTLESEFSALNVKADVDDLRNLSGANFDIDWQGKEIADTLEAFNLPIVTTGPVALKAKLDNQNGQLNGHLDGSVGDLSVAGDLKAPEISLLTDLHAGFYLKGLNAAAIAEIIGVDGVPKIPYELGFEVDSVTDGLHVTNFFMESADAEITGDALLPQLPTLIDADINLQLRGGNIQRFQGLTNALVLPLSPFAAELTMQGNGSGIPDTLKGELIVGLVKGSFFGRLSENTDYIDSTIDYSLTSPSMDMLVDLFGITLAKSDPLKAEGSIEFQKTGMQLKDLTVKIGNNEIRASGLIPAENTVKPIKINIRSSGPSFRGLMNYYFPVPFGPSEKFDLRGDLELSPDGMLVANNNGTVGSVKIKTNSAVVIGGKETDISLQIDAAGDNLDEWLQGFATEQGINEPFKIKSVFKLKGKKFSAIDFSVHVKKAKWSGNVETILSDGDEIFDNIRFDLLATGESLAEELIKFSTYEPASVAYQIAAKGEVNGKKMSLDKFVGELGDAKLDMRGVIDLASVDSPQQLVFDIRGDHLNVFGSIEGWDVVDIPFEIKGIIESSENTMQLNNLKIILGPNDISGKLSVIVDDVSQIMVDIKSDNFELGAILTKEQNESLSSVLNDKVKGDGRIIPDTTIPTDILENYNADLKMAIGRLAIKENELKDVYLQANLINGILTVPSLVATTMLGNIDSSLSYKPEGDSYVLESQLRASNFYFPGAEKKEEFLLGNSGYDLDVDVKGTGTNTREIASTLNGYVWLRGGKKKVENIKYGSLFGDAFTEIGAMINPFSKKDPYMKVDCEAYLFEATDGILKTAPAILIKTEKLDVTSVGTINLKTEVLALGIVTEPRKGIGISASDLLTPFIRVGGTLESPKPEVNPGGSLIEGGAALYTGGLSIIAKGLYQRWIKAGKSCEQVENIGRDILLKRNPGLTLPG